IGDALASSGRGYQAFRWQAGSVTWLSGLAKNSDSSARALNDSGLIAGYSFDGSGIRRATLWTNGVPRSIDTLGGTESWAAGINDGGQAVGWIRFGPPTSSWEQPFLWNG